MLSKELTQQFRIEWIPYRDNWGATHASTSHHLDPSIISDVPRRDIYSTCEINRVGKPLTNKIATDAIEYLYMGATTWACAGYQIKNNIIVEVDGCNTNPAGEGLIIGVERYKNIMVSAIEDVNFWATARACASDNVCNAIAVSIVDADSNATNSDDLKRILK